MIKNIDPLTIGVVGFTLLGFGYTMSNPNTRALFSQRNMTQQLQEAARIEAMSIEAKNVIAANRQNCTPVPVVSPNMVYSLPVGSVICGGGMSATIGTDHRPVLIAQEVKP